jgi:hypothetical protein
VGLGHAHRELGQLPLLQTAQRSLGLRGELRAGGAVEAGGDVVDLLAEWGPGLVDGTEGGRALHRRQHRLGEVLGALAAAGEPVGDGDLVGTELSGELDQGVELAVRVAGDPVHPHHRREPERVHVVEERARFSAPKTGPIEGSRRHSRARAPTRPIPWASPMEVVVFPSPAEVGVMPVTTTTRPSGASARRSRTESATFPFVPPVRLQLVG